jgi:hypothetical protein
MNQRAFPGMAQPARESIAQICQSFRGIALVRWRGFPNIQSDVYPVRFPYRYRFGQHLGATDNRGCHLFKMSSNH